MSGNPPRSWRMGLVLAATAALTLLLASCGGGGATSSGSGVREAAADAPAAVAAPSGERLRQDGAWMTQLANATETGTGARVGASARVGEVLMPGSHDAGTWGSIGWLDKACADSAALVDLGNVASVGSAAWNTITKWAYTQYDELYYQAQGGARYFDLRAIRDKSPGDEGHFLRACHTTIGPGLDAFFDPAYPGSLAAYANEHPGEVMVVDWQAVLQEGPEGQRGSITSPEAIAQFREYIIGQVCPGRALKPSDVPDGATVATMTLSDITSKGRTIVNVMSSGPYNKLYSSLTAEQKASWCIFDRSETLDSYWYTGADAKPCKNGFDYAKARENLFANQAGWIQSPLPRKGTFHVNQNIWTIDGDCDVVDFTVRKGLRDWTETELRPFQKAGFIDKVANDSIRLGKANVLMVDFMATQPAGTAWDEVSLPWIKLNCKKFAVKQCPW